MLSAFGVFVLLALLFGQQRKMPPPGDVTPPGPAPSPGPLPPQPSPWPSPAPADLPPWPSGWEFDNPPPPEVQRKAWELLPTLWKTGAGTRRVELTGARWITYVAEWHPGGLKGVTAYRVKGSRPVTPGIPKRGPDVNVPTSDPVAQSVRRRK